MRKVITYGTFDLFHRGHYNILKRAKEEGDYLIVGVTGETYDAERGKLSVQDSLATRIENVKATGFADKIIVEEYLGQKIPDIQKYHVDVLVIGSDWKGKFDHLSKYCEIKYLERTKDISSTQLREENLQIYKVGIITDGIDDDEVISESLRVSGIHIDGAYSEKEEIAKDFCKKYELFKAYETLEEMYESVDIIYVKTEYSKRKNNILKALNADKHVVCDVPFAMSEKESAEIYQLATDKGLIFMENVPLLYQHAFGQLLWMARGNLIGDLKSITCSMSKNMFSGEKADYRTMAFIIYSVILKIFGTKYKDVFTKVIKNTEDEVSYVLSVFDYEESIATAEISMDMDNTCEMTILGTGGKIYIPDDWWRLAYFKMQDTVDGQVKRYSSNFEGNGYRYLVQSLLREIKMKDKLDIQGLSGIEGITVAKILGDIRQ